MKTFFKFLLGSFVFGSTLIVVMATAGSWWAYNNFTKPGPLEETTYIIVPNGANIGDVAEMLEAEGALEIPMIFSYTARVTQQADKIKAGEYEITPHMSMKQILNLLESGKVVQRNVTVREGLTSYEVVKILRDVKGLHQDEIVPPEEGSLLAETYSYSKGEHVSQMIRRMQDARTAAIDELWETRAPLLPLKTKEEAIILASIVEKETSKADERKRVAGVFINRLRKGMLLQTDPTVIYALTMGEHQNKGRGPLGRRLLRKDLEYDSPYNTYKYPGLPPGPICNPGRAAIEAVLQPEDHKYIYFVADGTGGHAFAKTLAEHNRNVAQWRKIRNAGN